MRDNSQEAETSSIRFVKTVIHNILCAWSVGRCIGAAMVPLLMPALPLMLWSTTVNSAPAGGKMVRLWHVGGTSNPWSDSNFALAPDGWRRYKHDGFLVVGRSDPKTSWPYVQPGPEDGWAGHRQHTFTVDFGLKRAVAGQAMLVLRFAATQPVHSPKLRIRINDAWSHIFRTPRGRSNRPLNGHPRQGRPYILRAAFPASALHAGNNLIRITSTAGSWCIYHSLSLYVPGADRLTVPRNSLVIERAATDSRYVAARSERLKVRLNILRIGRAVNASIQIGGRGVPVALKAGLHRYEISIPRPQSPGTLPVVISIPNHLAVRSMLSVPAAKPFTIFILPHSHTDIGFKYYQPVALRLHADYIIQALRLIQQTKNQPRDAQFRWNLECMIEAREFMKIATPAQKKAFLADVANGHIGLDALYDNELTGLCQPEELLHYVAYARHFERKYRVSIDSAMISDVPGYTWGMVPVLSKAGVKYWSWGPNRGYSQQWNNQPFYWLSPSGHSRVLVWQSCRGYQSAFAPHRPGGMSANYRRDAAALRHFINQFAVANPQFPYSMIYTRWTIGDNGPPDPNLSRFVARWNARYTTPHLIIATTRQAFRALAAKYGKTLPSYTGDYNGYWEDGAASAARTTAMSRRAGNRLSQDQMLWAMLHAPDYPSREFNRAWRDVLLFDEHSWGADCAWRQPYRRFTREQWAWKRRYAVRATHISNVLRRHVTRALHAPAWSRWFGVFNTCNWTRSSLVTVPPALALARGALVVRNGPRSAKPPTSWKRWVRGVHVMNARNQPMPCQRMRDQSLVFLARNVPGLAARRYYVAPGHSSFAFSDLTPARVRDGTLSNGLIRLHVNATTGAIDSLYMKGIAGNLVNAKNKTARGLNDYIYVLGAHAKNLMRSGLPIIRVLADGPLVAELEIRSSAPGCSVLIRRISLVAGRKEVYISDLLDKRQVYPKHEAVYLGFPFAVSHGVIRYDEPWSVIRLGRDQLKWAHKNSFTENRWVDVSNHRFGVTWAGVSAPMFDVGRITSVTIEHGQPSPPHVVGGSTIYSYVMNNYWRTNYRAFQCGMTVFHYVLRPHQVFSRAAAQRFGLDTQQPLVAALIPPHAKPFVPPLTVTPASVLVEACHPDPHGNLSVRLFNVGRHSAVVHLMRRRSGKTVLFRTGIFGHHPRELTGPLVLAPLQFATIQIQSK